MAPDPAPLALVTGGAGGVGLATARALHGAGHRVALLGRGRASLEAAQDALPFAVRLLQADTADRAAVAAAVAELRAAWGPPTVLVTAAGIAESSPFLGADDALWARTLATNATGAWVAATACVPGMVEAGGGTIVHVASTAALQGYPYVAAYVASKHAVLGLARAMAVELGPRGIRTHAVCPGFLDTPMTDRSVESVRRATGATEAEARARLAALNASGKLVQPQAVAEAIVRLVRDGSLNGEVVVLE